MLQPSEFMSSKSQKYAVSNTVVVVVVVKEAIGAEMLWSFSKV
jgi:hypothetical protein